MTDNIKIFGLVGSGALTVVMVGGFGLLSVSKWLNSDNNSVYEIFGIIMIIISSIGLVISATVDMQNRSNPFR